MDWDDFYDRFSDWSEETQKQKIRSLASFGPSGEITEIAQELWDDAAVDLLIGNALNAGVRFTPREIAELADLISADLHPRLLRSAAGPYGKEDLENMEDAVDPALLEQIARDSHISPFFFDEEDQVSPAASGKRSGSSLWAVLLGGGTPPKNRNRRVRCTGDCASCPPHYGYRYGRWYYGHCHQYGCEFGGNRGDGSVD